MKAYVELIQRKERELGTDVLTHQKVGLFALSVVDRGADAANKWSGADYADNLIKTDRWYLVHGCDGVGGHRVAIYE